MKNKIVKLCMMVMLAGSMAVGSSAAVWAEEGQTEAAETVTNDASDTEEAVDMEDLYGYWQIGLYGYIITPDHQMYDEYMNYIGSFDITDEKAVFDADTLSKDWLGDVEDPEIILELLPMDLNQFGVDYDAEQYYVDNTDSMLKITILQKDKNDPMSTEKAENVNYGVKSKQDYDNQKYLQAMLFGYTWTTDNGTVTITKDGSLSLNDGEQTGTVNIYEGPEVDFKWEDAGRVEYSVTETDKDQIVLEKMDGSGQTLVLRDKVKLEEETGAEISSESETEVQTKS